MSDSMYFMLHIRTSSPMNGPRGRHWSVEARRRDLEKKATAIAFLATRCGRFGPGYKLSPPLLVTLIRVGKRRLDSDNLRPALKSIRDELAKRLGVDDGDEAKIRFRYGQSLGEYAVHVRIEEVRSGEHGAATCDDPACREHWLESGETVEALV